MPLISVVIPTYNSEGYILDTMGTVFSQTFDDYEVVVSDDGSTDGTVDALNSFFARHPERKAKVILNDHEGPGAARNSGIEAAEGEWISFLDSDDIWYPKKLQRVVDLIEREEGTSLVCHSEIWEESPGDKLLNYSRSFDRSVLPFLSLFRQNALSTSAVTVKKELLVRAGAFDTTLPSAQDYDLWLRLALLPGIRIGYIEDPLGEYITREGNITSNIEQRHECLMRIAGKYSGHLKGVSRFPLIELLRFKGRLCSGTGLKMIRRGEYLKGGLLLARGMFMWPRFDWISKFISRKVL